MLSEASEPLPGTGGGFFCGRPCSRSDVNDVNDANDANDVNDVNDVNREYVAKSPCGGGWRPSWPRSAGRVNVFVANCSVAADLGLDI